MTKPIWPDCGCSQECESCEVWLEEGRTEGLIMVNEVPSEACKVWLGEGEPLTEAIEARYRKYANPKDIQAQQDDKVPLDLLEPAADEQIALVLQSGADKYGLRNFAHKDTPICARTYIAAVRRHVAAYLAGEEIDPDSGCSHWAHVGACAHVVLAAMEAGSFVDDR